MFLSQLFRRGADAGRPKPRASRPRGADRRRRRWTANVEALEQRALLAVNVTLNGNTVEILYNQPDVFGVTATSNQNVIVEIEDLFFPFTTTRVNVYVPSNPISIGAVPPPGVPNQQTWVFTGVEKIVAQVPTPAAAGVFNNSLTFKGIGETTDRIIFAGSGITAAGRWSDETTDEFQVLLETYGIDHHTITAGGIINVSGVFSNNENDASIHAIATIPEDAPAQYTGTVIVGEPTPIGGTLPNPRLESNFIEIIGAELDILSDIVATDIVILRAGENAPDASRASLVLPYDVTVTGSARPGLPVFPGRLELFSTKNIVQLPSSTLTASECVATSENANVAASAGPWMISLGSVGNDFDTIALGMTSAPGDAVNPATEGRIGVRDVDDLTVADFGILAATGQVRLESVGALTFAAPVQATGLIARSDDSITSSAASVMTLGVLGIDLLANDTSPLGAPTGNITLNGPVTVQAPAAAAATLVSNSIQGVGVVTIAGRFRSPDAGSTKIVSTGTTTAVPNGVVISAPVQVGSTTFDAPGKAVTVNTHDLSLISHGGAIAVSSVPGNAATPYAVQATNIVTLDSASTVTVGGSIVAGSIYGNPAALTATEALPSITVRGTNSIDVLASGSLRTVAYNTDPGGTTNPLVGRIMIVSDEDPTAAATAVRIAGVVNADGAVAIGGPTGITGSVTVAAGGSVTGRESVVIRSAGMVDIYGPVASTGGTYAAAPAAGSQRIPDVLVESLSSTIETGGQGTIRAGTVAAAGVTAYGTVTLNAQQTITVGAAIDTPGGVVIASELGSFDLSALLRTSNPQAVPQAVTISTGSGMLQSDLELARIVTADLTLTNTAAGDLPVTDPLYTPSSIDLQAKNNQITTLTAATNFSVGGDIRISNNGLMSIGAGGIKAMMDAGLPSTVALAAKAGIVQAAPIVGNNLTVSNVGTGAIALTNPGNDVDNFAASNPVGAVNYVDSDGFETGVNRTGPLRVEVRGTNVGLSSVQPFSTIRVVSGLAYNGLSIAAGTQSGTTVGTVELVPTSTGDNPAPAGKVPAFAGTLRDMIRYVNDNTAVYTVNQSNRTQPMAIVFDEDSFPVDEIKLAAALPTFNRAVTFDGGRLETTVLAAGQTRLGITVAAAPSTLPHGLSFGPATPAIPGKLPAYPGSAGSRIEDVAIYGFTKGSALVLGSGNNTVTNVYAGLKADGTSDATTGNSVGLDITGVAAAGNRVGTTVFDVDTVNRFGGNSSAGILIRNGASGTQVYGSVVGDPLNLANLATATPANGEGIRISAATGNLIGTPDEVQPDQTDSVSNVIAGNTGAGVSIVSSVAGSTAAANVLQNNLISDNRVGVSISGSRFAVLGGQNGEGANVIVSQKADGVAIANSADVQLFGNLIGITPASATAVEALAGNTFNGVNVTGTSRGVQIAGGNRISANGRNGIFIGTGVTGTSITGNTIGGVLDDGLDTPAGNGRDGVAIDSAVGNTVGAGNTISKNARHGVSVVDARAANLAAGNRILGSTVVDNDVHGVYVSGGSGSTIGGTGAGDGNVIQANDFSGIYLERSGRTGVPTGYAIQGNFVGTNTNLDIDATLGNEGGGIVVNDGTGVRIEGNVVMNNERAADPNPLNVGDPNDGITLRGGTGNVIGGTTAAQGNVIANNTQDGIRVIGPSAARAARGHWILGNTIVDNGSEDLDTLQKVGNGVTVTGGFARGITVGQSVTTAGVRGRGNVIQRNFENGVRVAGGAQQISIQGNSIAENELAGISVAVGSNTSTAAGIRLDRAVIRQPIGSQTQVLLQGRLTGVAQGQQYTVDVYANSPQDDDYGGFQARRFLGRVTVTATANGTITWGPNNPLRISANVAVGEVITATVTSLRIEPGSTSNLSNAVAANR